MRITPLDIRKQEFRKAMRGLDAEEVYAFLSTVGDEYEAILNDNKTLRDRVIELDQKVEEYRRMEKTLRDTLLTAERVTVEAKDNARREASLIIKEAQIEADKSLRDIKSQAMRLRQEVSQLRSQRESYLGRMKVIAESLLKFIGSVEDDFYKEDEAYKEQLPDEVSPRRSSTRPERPLKSANLFDDNRDDRDVDGAGGPGKISHAQAGPATDVDDRFPAAPAIGPKSRIPGADKAPAPRPDEARNESDSQATMARINSIIDRMAEGQAEIVGRPASDRAEPESRAKRPGQSFDPVSDAPAGPIATGDFHEEPPKTLEATTTTDDPTPPRGIARVRPAAETVARSEEERVRAPEVATAVETVDESHEASEKKEEKSRVTREISLEQIRRDLERRMLEDREG